MDRVLTICPAGCRGWIESSRSFPFSRNIIWIRLSVRSKTITQAGPHNSGLCVKREGSGLQELQDEDDDSVDEPDFHGESIESAADDDAETIPCPHCGKQIHEEAQRCPHCGDYVSEDHPPNRR